MADPEHLKRLTQDVAAWNVWRHKDPHMFIDLSRADLREANLKGADLREANLTKADLTNARLTGAILGGADFGGANLTKTDLTEAVLSILGPIKTNLGGANLNQATLYFTDLIGVHLGGADFSNARFSNTKMADLDLRSTKGLTTILHLRPSVIDLPTVLLPADGSALHFLRGVGVPDDWIAFYQATMMHPIQYHSCFISYASQDTLVAQRLHADLQAAGVRCWFAPHDLKPGDFFREKIDNAIHVQDKLLLILSEHSVASKWVRYEVNLALDREVNQERTILFPIRLDDAILHTTSQWAADLRSRRHIGDFTNWQDFQGYQDAFSRFLNQLTSS